MIDTAKTLFRQASELAKTVMTMMAMKVAHDREQLMKADVIIMPINEKIGFVY
jgi:hypothetical protein